MLPCESGLGSCTALSGGSSVVLHVHFPLRLGVAGERNLATMSVFTD